MGAVIGLACLPGAAAGSSIMVLTGPSSASLACAFRGASIGSMSTATIWISPAKNNSEHDIESGDPYSHTTRSILGRRSAGMRPTPSKSVSRGA